MKVRSIFFKVIALCAILILSSCQPKQSKEEKVISRINDLAEKIEKKGELYKWDDADRFGIVTEYTLILKDMQNCEFTNEQQIELLKAYGNVSVALGSIYGNGLPEGMEDMLKGAGNMLDGMKAYSDGLDESDLEGMEDMLKGMGNMLDGMKAYSDGLDESDEVSEDENKDEDVDVVGTWMWIDENAHMDSFTIESDGKFYQSGYLSMEEEGTWYLSGHNIIFKYSDGRTIACNVTGNTIIVNDYEYDRM